MSSQPRPLESVCVFCGSSAQADPALMTAAAALGVSLASQGLRLVYGGGGVGLMGACAMAAHGAGGRVLGVIPKFLTAHEHPPAVIETAVVTSMHERKMRMFEEADAFAVMPGGIGTLEEAIELLSWRRLGLHVKPIVFYDPGGFWRPLFALFSQMTGQNLVPAEFAACWRAVDDIAAVIPALRAMPTDVFTTPIGA